MIERKYYYREDAEGNAEGLCGQPEIQQHYRDHGCDEEDAPGRLATGDRESWIQSWGTQKPADVGTYSNHQKNRQGLTEVV